MALGVSLFKCQVRGHGREGRPEVSLELVVCVMGISLPESAQALSQVANRRNLAANPCSFGEMGAKAKR